MGLDIIEFIMAVEEKFTITISDREAEKLTTVRELVDYLVTKVKAAENRNCLTQREFYRLRRALITRHWTTRQDLTPYTPLEQIVPRANRHVAWQQLGEEIQATDWPELTRSGFIRLSIFLLGAVAFSLPWCLRGGSLQAGDLSTWLWSIVLVTFVGWVGVAATRSWKVAFPPQYSSIGKLVPHLIGKSQRTPATSQDGWTREQVRLTVRALAAEQFGVEDFSDDSHFVDDLRVD